MCFSSTASFVAAGLTCAIGVVTLARAPTLRHFPLAAIPMVFGLQQSIEGFIWMRLEAGVAPGALPSLYAFLAEAFWPLLIPVSVLLIEPGRIRQLAMVALAVVGGVFFIGFSWVALNGLYAAEIEGDCIRYSICFEWSSRFSLYPFSTPQTVRVSGLSWLVVPYAMVTIGSLLIASRSYIRWFGYASGLGLVLAGIIRRSALVSVWCFFAAIAAIIIVIAIERERRKIEEKEIHELSAK
jgi:uncharacterized protein DUF6629